MKIQNLIDELLDGSLKRITDTVDTVKCGSAEKEATRIGTCFMATAEVVRKAEEVGIEFLITHEPTYYNHRDIDRPDHPVVREKRKLVEESGLTIWRFHDHIHNYSPDGIVEGVMKELGWEGREVAPNVWQLTEARTVRKMASEIRERLGAGGVRATGQLDMPFDRVLMAVGDPGANSVMMDRLLTEGFTGVIFVGETSEWGALEQIRDAAYFGMPLAALTLGHDISEEAGMKLLAEKIAGKHPELTVEFIPTGEVYAHL